MDSDNRELIKMLADSFDETAAIEIDKNNNDNIARITAENINYMSNTVIASVSRRFNEMTFISGAAAGGEVTGFDNVWIRGLIGTGKEKQGQDRYGYKSNIRGVIAGVDYLINEDFIAGISYSNLYSRVKSKKDKVLQNIGINSNILSLYGQYDLTNKIYMQGMLSAGKNKIKTDRTLTILAKDYRGKAKFRNTSYNLSLSAGYKVKFGNKGLMFVPNIGFDYGIHSDTEFKEKGLGIDNRTNKPNSYRSFTGNFGIKLLGNKVFVKNIILTPEVRTSVTQNLHTKKRKIQTKIGINDNYFETKIKNKEKIGFNVGASVVAKIKNKVDISLSYDVYARRKYQAYLGACQVKVYF